MLAVGDRIPEARIWTAPREGALPLSEALGQGMVLLCFYLWDWAPT